MTRRRVFLLLMFVACGGTPTQLNVTIENDGGAAGDAAGNANDAGASHDTSTNDSSTADASATDSSTWNGSVFGSTNYSAGNPGMNANASSAHTGQTPLQGKNCFQAGGCHSESSTVYAFMGTVFDGPSSTTGVKNAEVRVVSADGTTLANVHTDDDGNFWSLGALSASPSYVGVRTITASRVQTMPLTGTSKIACNSSACHGTSARIHVP